MNLSCDQIVERLPWLLNGTLTEEDRTRVSAHLEACRECQRELVETSEMLALMVTHPPAQDLALLVLGAEMSSLEREHLQSHLQHCPTCRAEVEMIRAESQESEAPADEAKVIGSPGWFSRRIRKAQSARQLWRLAAVLALLVGTVVVSRDMGHRSEPALLPPVEESGRIAHQGFEDGYIAQPANRGDDQVMVFADGFETGDAEDWPEQLNLN